MSTSPRLVFAATALLCACSSARPFRPFPASTSLDPGGGALDVEWVDDFAFVDVRIDGRPGHRFLLDTGASVVLLTPQAADALGLERLAIDRERGGFVLPGANASSKTIQRVAPIGELRCGPLTVRDLDAMEIDTSPLQRALGSAVDGILPATAFRDVLLTIDYPGRRVEVKERAAGMAAAAHTLPLLPGSLPKVALRVGEAEIVVLLDSGSSGFLTLPEHAPLAWRGEPAETGRQQTIGGAQPMRQARLAAPVDWAGHTLVDPVVEMGREAGGGAGVALLGHFRVELDQAGGVVRFTRDAATPLLSPPVRGMGLGFLRDATHWTVAYLLDGAPAARAGLLVGDQVVAVDGIDVTGLTRTAYERLLAERDELRLRVRAGDGTRDVAVPIVVLVP